MAKSFKKKSAPAPKAKAKPVKVEPTKKFEQNNMSGSLFVNTQREEGSNQPHYKGSAKINDVEFWVSGWKKQSKQKMVYVSLAFEEKEGQDDEPETDDDTQSVDDLPF